MRVLHRDKIVLLGMMSRMPVAGVVWQTVHYLLGLQRLGYDVYYVEQHGIMPTKLMAPGDTDDGSDKAAAYLDRMLRPCGLRDKWAFHALHSTGRCYGMDRAQLEQLNRSAALVINLHGGTIPLDEHVAGGRLVYLETDPVQLQIELHDNVRSTVDFLSQHSAFFTFGENWGRADCKLPTTDRFDFTPTRQPVVLDFWQLPSPGPNDTFTTIGNWRQGQRPVRLDGETYTWSKHEEFVKFLDLPRRCGQALELALSTTHFTDEDRRLLEGHGWRVRDALAFSHDPDPYRAYILSSRGEFTVAKDQNVRLRSGWFSDRSATYLAAGRPVITQETGFSNHLPTGEGLFAFSTADDALAAIDRINADYDRHCRAAAEVAREYFDSDVVLRRLLSHVGLQGFSQQCISRAGAAEYNAAPVGNPGAGNGTLGKPSLRRTGRP